MELTGYRPAVNYGFVKPIPWIYKDGWGQSYPSFGRDEFGRRTFVIPNPFKVTSVDDFDGMKYHPALVIPVLPWWATIHVFNHEYREDIKKSRIESQCFKMAMDVLLHSAPELWLVIETPYADHSEESLERAWDVVLELAENYEKAMLSA